MLYSERNDSLIIQKLQTHYFIALSIRTIFNIYLMLSSERSWPLLMISGPLSVSPLCARYFLSTVDSDKDKLNSLYCLSSA